MTKPTIVVGLDAEGRIDAAIVTDRPNDPRVAEAIKLRGELHRLVDRALKQTTETLPDGTIKYSFSATKEDVEKSRALRVKIDEIESAIARDRTAEEAATRREAKNRRARERRAAAKKAAKK